MNLTPEQVKQFEAWANGKGYDTAHTYDTERSRWIFLNQMTADLWTAWSAALSTQPQQAGWMPIETAPKDETPILIGHYYVDRVHEYSGPSRWLWVTSGCFDENTFWHDFTDEADPLKQDGSWKTATHWKPMDLPLPPVPGQEGGAHADQA